MLCEPVTFSRGKVAYLLGKVLNASATYNQADFSRLVTKAFGPEDGRRVLEGLDYFEVRDHRFEERAISLSFPKQSRDSAFYEFLRKRSLRVDPIYHYILHIYTSRAQADQDIALGFDVLHSINKPSRVIRWQNGSPIRAAMLGLTIKRLSATQVLERHMSQADLKSYRYAPAIQTLADYHKAEARGWKSSVV